jgi:hypothetical protein
VPSKIDLNLAVLDTILPSGESLYCWQIAQIAGCSTQRIQQIEAKALAKLRRKLAKEMPEKIAARFQPKRKPRTAVGRFQKWLAEVNPDFGISPS